MLKDPHGDNFPVFPGLLLAMLLILVPTTVRAEVYESQIPSLLNTIIRAESSGRAHIDGDGGRARGLMQIQKETWQRLTKKPWAHAYNPKINRHVGEKLVREIIKKYGRGATKAHVIFTYNTGRMCKGVLPKWSKRHPNKIYRNVFLSEKRSSNAHLA